MSNKQNSFCSLCRCKTEQTTHLSLYVIDSKGIDVCLSCRRILTNVAKDLMQTSDKVKMDILKKAELMADGWTIKF